VCSTARFPHRVPGLAVHEWLSGFSRPYDLHRTNLVGPREPGLSSGRAGWDEPRILMRSGPPIVLLSEFQARFGPFVWRCTFSSWAQFTTLTLPGFVSKFTLPLNCSITGIVDRDTNFGKTETDSSTTTMNFDIFHINNTVKNLNRLLMSYGRELKQ